MSHQAGRIFFLDGTVGWIEFSSTVDVALPGIYASRDAMQANWREERFPIPELYSAPTPDLIAHEEPVILESNVGSGPWWLARAIRFQPLVLGNELPADAGLIGTISQGRSQPEEDIHWSGFAPADHAETPQGLIESDPKHLPQLIDDLVTEEGRNER